MFILTLIRALVLSRTALALENQAQRQQVAVLKRSVPRPRIRFRDRIYWILMRRMWSGWRGSLHFVRPSTVIRWHRMGWRLLWRWRSSANGRPPVALEVRDLIRRLSGENRLWGAPRIQAELERLGHHVAKSTVERYMARSTRPPSGTMARVPSKPRRRNPCLRLLPSPDGELQVTHRLRGHRTGS